MVSLSRQQLERTAKAVTVRYDRSDVVLIWGPY
jgi:hypothetical protein